MPHSGVSGRHASQLHGPEGEEKNFDVLLGISKLCSVSSVGIVDLC